MPVGDAKAGIMICFESHFGELSREYVRRGADVIIEMTNDGYLGPTPVLRQHLANAVFRAIETEPAGAAGNKCRHNGVYNRTR